MADNVTGDPQACPCCYHQARREKAAAFAGAAAKPMPRTDASVKADTALTAAVQREEAARADFDAAASARRSQEISALASKTYDSATGREHYDPQLLAAVEKLRTAERTAYEAWQHAGNRTVEARQKAMAEAQRSVSQAIADGTF